MAVHQQGIDRRNSELTSLQAEIFSLADQVMRTVQPEVAFDNVWTWSEFWLKQKHSFGNPRHVWLLGSVTGYYSVESNSREAPTPIWLTDLPPKEQAWYENQRSYAAPTFAAISQYKGRPTYATDGRLSGVAAAYGGINTEVRAALRNLLSKQRR